jgi:hypothetical protein
MTKLNNFDVIVAYNQSIATSPSDSSPKATTPFAANSRNQAYNDVYAYFLQTCEANNLKAGYFRSFWTFVDHQWTKFDHPCYSNLIFDKFSPTNQLIKSKRQQLFSTPAIIPFNNPLLFDIFFDKQKTFDSLPLHTIPTVSIAKNTTTGVTSALKSLKKLISKHHQSQDFNQKVVLKDRYGAGGQRVYQFTFTQIPQILAAVSRHPKISFIIQPLVKFDQGFIYQKISAPTDIRLIYLNGEIVQSYIRIAKKGEFRCNEHLGGSLIYVASHQIPKKLITISNKVIKSLVDKSSLFALDFIVSNRGHVYLLEGNTSPGLDWNLQNPLNEIEAKKLIKLIVKDLVVRTLPPASSMPNTTSPYLLYRRQLGQTIPGSIVS